jgi:hypothetical protein
MSVGDVVDGVLVSVTLVLRFGEFGLISSGWFGELH